MNRIARLLVAATAAFAVAVPAASVAHADGVAPVQPSASLSCAPDHQAHLVASGYGPGAGFRVDGNQWLHFTGGLDLFVSAVRQVKVAITAPGVATFSQSVGPCVGAIDGPATLGTVAAAPVVVARLGYVPSWAALVLGL